MRALIFAVFLGTALSAQDPRCTKPGFQVHSTDCRKFIECTNELEAIEQQCTNGLEFNPILKKCDRPRGFCTVKRSLPVGQVMSCHGLQDSAYYPDYTDNCQSFYYCDRGIPKVGKCEEGNLFDKITLQCISKDLVECRPTDDTPVTSPELDCTESDSVALGNINDNCKSYFHCDEGTPMKTYCEGSLIYNSVLKRCDWPTNVECGRTTSKGRSRAIMSRDDYPKSICVGVRNEHVVGPNRKRNCASYFVCREDELVEEFCGGQLIFNSDLGICDFPENIEDCKLISTVEKAVDCWNQHSVVYAHPFDCSAFLTCVMGKPVLSRCQLGERFDSITERCIADPEHVCKATKNRLETVESLVAESATQDNQDTSRETLRIPNMMNGCKSYFECSNGLCTKVDCKSGLAYNSATGKCEPAENVFCENPAPVALIRARACTCICHSLTNDAWFPDENDCTGFFVCYNGQKVKHQCHAGQYFDSNTLQCTPGTCGLRSCGSTPHGASVADTNCRNYQQCVNGQLVKSTCAQGTYYDQTRGMCVINNGQCPLERTSGLDCGALANGHFAPDQSNCINFFVCAGGSLRKMSCQDGSYFNSESLQCVDDDGTCPFVKSVQLVTSRPSDNCGAYANGAKVRSQVDCTQYSICCNGELINQQCPNGQYFSTIFGDCIVDDGVCRPRLVQPAEPPQTNLDCGPLRNGQLEPDQYNCARFFSCSSGQLQHLSCPEGQYFSKTLLQCMNSDGTCKDVSPNQKIEVATAQPQNVGCGDYRNGEQVKDASNCQAYKICCNGEWVSQQCSTGEYFNDNTRTCMPDNGICVPVTQKPTNCGRYSDGEFVADNGNCVNFFVCVRGELKKLECANGQYFNRIQGECVNDDGTCADVIKLQPIAAQVTARAAGTCGIYQNGDTWPDTDCKSYFICCNGQTSSQSCPSGQYYNSNARACVSDNGQCVCPPTIAPPPTQCNCGNYTNGEFIPDNSNCVRFFTCANGKMMSLSCPDGQYFNTKHKRCFDDDGTCKDVIPTTPKPDTCCGNLTNGQKTPDPNDCTKYCICCNGQLISQSCCDGCHFDSELQTCVIGPCEEKLCANGWTNGTIEKDENNCAGYSICINGVIKNETCKSGEFFNPETKQCEIDENNICSTTTPSGSSTTTPEEFTTTPSGSSTTTPNGSTSTPNGSSTTTPEESTPTPSGSSTTTPNGSPTTPNGSSTTTPEESTTTPSGSSTTTPNGSTSTPNGSSTTTPEESTTTPSGSSTTTPNGSTSTPNGSSTTTPEESTTTPSESSTTTPNGSTSTPNGSSTTTPEESTTTPSESSTTTPNGSTSTPNGSSTTTPEESTTTPSESSTTTPNGSTSTPNGSSTSTTGEGSSTSSIGSTVPTTEETSSTPGTIEGLLNCTEEGKDYGDGAFIPNKANCSLFLLCCNGTVVELSCPKDYYWNAVIEICTKDPSVCNGRPECTGDEVKENPNDCTGYYKCENGSFITKTCEQGYYFNATLGKCDLDKGQCVKCTEGELIENDDDCTGYYKCVNGEFLPENCDSGLYFNNDEKKCVPDLGQCQPCTGDEEKENPNDCTGYYKCENGTFIAKTCDEGYYFNATAGKCVLDMGECVKCTTGEIIKNDEDCTGYYTCIDGEFVPGNCESGFYFNNLEKKCVPDLGQCKQCTGDEEKENPNDCTGYYKCENGTFIAKTCDEGYYFNATAGKCDLDMGECVKCTTGEIIKNDEDCTGYYTCIDGEFVPGNCESGFYFNNLEKKCEEDNRGQCKPLNCGDVTHGGNTTDPNDCTKYFVCINGSYVLEACPEGHHYNSTFGECIEGDCPPPVIDVPEDCGSIKDGDFAPHEYNCSAFYLCCNGSLVEFFCPAGYFWDYELELCGDDYSGCLTATTTTAIPEVLCENGWTSNQTGTNSSLRCDEYYLCLNGDLVTRTCPEAGQFFNPETKNCEDSNGSCKPPPPITPPAKCEGGVENGEFVSDLTNCAGYLICCDGRLISKICRNGYYFNSEEKRCVVDNGQCKKKDCDGVPDGEFVGNQTHCTAYLICCDGRFIAKECPEGYYFNNITKVCELNDQGQCPLECDSSGQKRPIPGNCLGYEECIGGKWTEATCQSSYYFNYTSGECEMNNNNQCPESCEGVLNGETGPDSDCSRFRLCCDGKLLVLYCKYGYRYDPELRDCIIDANNDCPLPTLPPTDTLCEKYPNGTAIQNLENCRGYFICVTGRTIPGSCRSNEYFDAHDGVCKIGDCTNQDFSIANSKNNGACGKFANGALIVNIVNCHGYYECINGDMVSRQCPSGQYFDINTNQCRLGSCSRDVPIALSSPTKVSDSKTAICSPDSYGTYVADPNDCSSYYICYYSIPVRQTCPPGQYFDLFSTVCSDDRGQCKSESASPICFGRHGVMIRHPTDCKRFYICANGETILYQCKKDEFFNPTTSMCEKDHNKVCNQLPSAVGPRSDFGGHMVVNCTGYDEGTLLKNSDDCSAYYVCSNGYAMPSTCPSGYSFDDKRSYCKPDNGQCEKSFRYNQKVDRSVMSLCDGLHGVLVADTKDCSRFYVCTYGKILSHEKCLPGEYFDNEMKRCNRNTGHCIDKLEGASKICTGKIEGAYLPDQSDCTKFVMCSQGHAIPQQCSEGMFFDPVHKYCRANDGTCIPTDNSLTESQMAAVDPCYKKQGVYVAGDDCDQFKLCVNGKPIALLRCMPGFHFDKQTQACKLDVEKVCQTQSVTSRKMNVLPSCLNLSTKEFYANPLDDCRTFFKCAHDVAHMYTCPEGLIFNALMQQCDYPEFTKCIDNAAIEEVTCVGKITGFRYVNGDNGCRSFFVCANGQNVEKFCENGMLYNAELGVCDWSHNVQCSPTEKLVATGGRSKREVQKQNSGIESGICNGLQDNKFFGNARDECRSFFKCVNNVAHLFTCPPGLMFNSDTENCDYPFRGPCYDHLGQRVSKPPCLGAVTGTMVENIQNGCQSFYICDNNKPIEQFCQDGMLFNTETNVCDWSHNVRCGLVPSTQRSKRSFSITKPKHIPNCYGIEQDKFYAITDDNCRSFFKCIDYKPFMYTCPSGLIFNARKNECDWPQASQCIDETGHVIRPKSCIGAKDNTLLENVENNCESYFICERNQAIEQFCPDHMLFNVNLQTCDWADNVRCGMHFNDRRKREIGEKLPECKDIKEEKLYGITDDDCKSFFECVDQQPMIYVCPPGLVFNTLKEECDYPADTKCVGPEIDKVEPVEVFEPCLGKDSGTYLENSRNGCRSFFVCDNGEAIEKFCKEGMLFNAESQVCDWAQNVKCGASTEERRSKRSIKQGESIELPSCHGVPEDKPFGLAKDNCQSFYKCIGGKALVQRCPPGLIFNSLKSECDWPQSGQCFDAAGKTIQLPPCLGAPTGTFVENIATGCQSFFICDNNHAIEQSCQPGMLFNARTNVCDWSHNVQCGIGRSKRSIQPIKPKYSPSCYDVQANKFYGIAEDNCHSFFKCIDNTPFVYTCPQGLIFNSLKNECDWPQLSQCNDARRGIFIKPATCLGAKDSTLLENIETNCRSYFLCEHNKALERFCQDGMLFNAKTKACDWAENVNCGSHFNLRRRREIIDNLPACDNVESDRFYGMTHDGCQSFFKCIDNKPLIFSCPVGLVFNGNKSQCDYPEMTECKGPEVIIEQQPCLGKESGTLIANQQNNCQSFFICDNNKSTEKFCKKGMRFNAETKVCDWPENVRCDVDQEQHRKKRSISTPTCWNAKPDKFYGIANDDCQSFYKCVGHHAFIQSCPPGLVFNSLKDECDWPQNSQCFDVNGIAIRQPPCMGAKSGTFVENLQTNCQSFFICDNDRPIEQHCQGGMKFNAQIQACDWPQNVHCGSQQRRKRELADNLPSCKGIVQNKFYGLTSDGCKTFYKCVADHPFVYSCPAGLVFNSLKNECDYPDVSKCTGPEADAYKKPCRGLKSGERIPNYDKLCHSFYACDNNEAFEEFCKGDMLFNPELKVCDWPQNVRCNVSIVESFGKLFKRISPAHAI